MHHLYQACHFYSFNPEAWKQLDIKNFLENTLLLVEFIGMWEIMLHAFFW